MAVLKSHTPFVTTKVKESKLTIKDVHESFPVAEGIHCFKRTRSVLPATKANVAAFAKNEQGFSGPGVKRTQGFFITLLGAKDLETARTLGYTEMLEKVGTREWQRREMPFDLLRESKNLQPFYVDTGSHTLFNLNGEPMPVAVYFDYCSGSVHNKAYDLDKLFKHLSKRKDIAFLKPEGIPYYNRDSGRTNGLTFYWQPSIADFRKMWKFCLTLNPRYPSTAFREAIKKLNLLGMERFRRPEQPDEDD